MTQPITHEITFRVRYAETDQMGIVHHRNYFVWFEEVRSDSLRVRGTSYSDFEAEGLFMPLTAAEARYVAPARYDQQVTVRVTVERVRSRTIEFGYEVFATETGQLLATGKTKHIVTNREGHVVSWPEHWRARIGAV